MHANAFRLFMVLQIILCPLWTCVPAYGVLTRTYSNIAKEEGGKTMTHAHTNMNWFYYLPAS